MPTTLRLERFAYLDEGTFGRLFLPSGQTFYTVERPWLDNLVRKSCIPQGLYPMKKTHFNRGGYEVYEIKKVPGRSEILIHIANWPKEVVGCIGVGLGLAIEKLMITSSTLAVERLMEELEDYKELELLIQAKQAIYVK